MGELSSEAKKAAALVRDYGKNEVPVDFIERKMGVERGEAVALLRDLSEAGYGALILGRKGGKTRIRKADTLLDGAGSPQQAAAPSAIASDLPDFQVFSLRRSTPIPIRVPADLTLAEAEKLSAWLKLIAEDDKKSE